MGGCVSVVCACVRWFQQPSATETAFGVVRTSELQSLMVSAHCLCSGTYCSLEGKKKKKKKIMHVTLKNPRTYCHYLMIKPLELIKSDSQHAAFNVRHWHLTNTTKVVIWHMGWILEFEGITNEKVSSLTVVTVEAVNREPWKGAI